jgi:hypothetical protein
LHVSSLNGYSDDCFAIGTAASFAWFLAAYEKLIHFNSPGQFLAILAYGAPPKLLQPAPSGAVTAQA